MKKIKKVFMIILILTLILIALFLGYFENYYHADNVVENYLISDNDVKVEKIEEGYFFDGLGTDKALIFYPGAKVETKAYSRLMRKLAENGIDCFLINMPFRFAFFGINKADSILNQYQYENWSIGGHSLGGVAANIYLNKNSNKFSSLILIGSYPTKNIPENVSLYSIYGSNDSVLNKEAYDNAKQYWNNNSKELIINGANHASIADYGVQKGDGTLDIDREEVMQEILDFIN